MDSIVLFQNRIKPVLNFHPWIFTGAVKHLPQTKKAEIVAVKSEAGNVLGYGFLDHGSQIVCRIFHFTQDDNSDFNLDFWREKFSRAHALRTKLLISSQTDSYRLVHAEGDFLPGIIADVYGGSTVFLHTLIEATHRMIETWSAVLLEMGFQHIYWRKGQEKKGSWIKGEAQNKISALENGLLFGVDVENGQKTGFFIDQRDNRKHIQQISKNRKVLNAFGYTGGFSVYALAGGAREVVTVDISENACTEASQNVAVNQLDASRHTAVKADCFDYLKTMDSDFDLIILDPPAFAKSKNAVDKAARGYKEINLTAFKKIREQGILATFSCSQHIDKDLFRKIVFGAAADSGRAVRIIQQLTQPADHPISIYHPEGEYLKGLLLLVE